MKYPELNLYKSVSESSNLICLSLSSHLTKVGVISTNSFYELRTPNDRVYSLFRGEITFFPLTLFLLETFSSSNPYTTNLSPAWREFLLVKGYINVSVINHLIFLLYLGLSFQPMCWVLKSPTKSISAPKSSSSALLILLSGEGKLPI